VIVNHKTRQNLKKQEEMLNEDGWEPAFNEVL